MWPRHKFFLPVVASLIIFGCSVAFAQPFPETGVHTSPTGIRHGCPGDPGCVGGDDYYREAYSRTVTDEAMSYTTLDVLRADDLTSVGSAECISVGDQSCLRVDLWYATGNEPECKFLTAHYVRDRLVEDPPMPVATGAC
jgi:hypothetical protein